MYALVCVTLAGATQASTEYSPVEVIMEASLPLDAVEACALLPAARLIPQPPTQVTLPVNCKSASGLTPLVSYAVVPVPVLNSYFAIRLASERLPPEATVPSFSFKPLERSSAGSTAVTLMAPANVLIADNIAAELPAQS